MTTKSWPAIARLQAAVQVDAVLHEIICERDFLVRREIEHEKESDVRVGEGDVLAVTGHVFGGSVEQERVGVHPRSAKPSFKLREARRRGGIRGLKREQKISLQVVDVIDGLRAI